MSFIPRAARAVIVLVASTCVILSSALPGWADEAAPADPQGTSAAEEDTSQTGEPAGTTEDSATTEPQTTEPQTTESQTEDPAATDGPAQRTTTTGSEPAPCVDASAAVLSHSFSKNTASVTYSGAGPLCEELHVLIASWSYDDPSSGNIWPQTLEQTDSVSILEPGNYSVGVEDRCGQFDVYAKIGSAPSLPGHLFGSNNPYEPAFLHLFSAGPITWNQDPATSCSYEPEPPVVGPTASIQSACAATEAYAPTIIDATLDNTASTVDVTFSVTVTRQSDLEVIATETVVVAAGQTHPITRVQLQWDTSTTPPTPVTARVVISASVGSTATDLVDDEVTTGQCGELPPTDESPSASIESTCATNLQFAPRTVLVTLTNPLPGATDFTVTVTDVATGEALYDQSVTVPAASAGGAAQQALVSFDVPWDESTVPPTPISAWVVVTVVMGSTSTVIATETIVGDGCGVLGEEEVLPPPTVTPPTVTRPAAVAPVVRSVGSTTDALAYTGAALPILPLAGIGGGVLLLGATLLLTGRPRTRRDPA